MGRGHKGATRYAGHAAARALRQHRLIACQQSDAGDDEECETGRT